MTLGWRSTDSAHAKITEKWRVSRIKGNAAHHYGTVEAPSADAAVRKIVAEYQIYDPEILKRLAARPVDA